MSTTTTTDRIAKRAAKEEKQIFEYAKSPAYKRAEAHLRQAIIEYASSNIATREFREIEKIINQILDRPPTRHEDELNRMIFAEVARRTEEIYGTEPEISS